MSIKRLKKATETTPLTSVVSFSLDTGTVERLRAFAEDRRPIYGRNAVPAIIRTALIEYLDHRAPVEA